MSVAYLYTPGVSTSGLMQKKNVTPSQSVQLILPDSGYDGLESVTVEAIPEEYADMSDATARSEDIVSGKVAYSSGGRIVGSMVKRNPVSEKLSADRSEYTLPSGYYAEGGRVYAELEEKSIAPLEIEQTVLPSDGKLISKVIIGAVKSPKVSLENGILSIS